MSNEQRRALKKKRVGVQRFITIPACSSDVIEWSHVRRCLSSATLEVIFQVPRIIRISTKMKCFFGVAYGISGDWHTFVRYL